MDGAVSIAYEQGVAAGQIAPDAAQRAAVAQLDALLARLSQDRSRAPRGLAALWRRPQPEPVRGLYLWGPVGRGKSMLMDLFHTAAPEKRKRRVHFHAFMQEIHAGLHVARQQGVEDAIAPVAMRIAASTRLLCFDEMQITDITDAMIVGRLFEKLFAAGVVVVTTSNRPPRDLYKDGLNRQLFLPFIAMLEDRLEVVELGGATDHRQRLGPGENLWFAPLGEAAASGMGAVWSALAGGPGAELRLSVGGREVILPEARDGIVRADFETLCARPLGPADYLALAGMARVLLLSDIPRLSRARNNEAKRFVTLIDALYEARVGLVASAAAEPEALYIEGPGAFEFQRTASRLAEMRSREWLEAALERPRD
ncbi:MAG: AFG1 family ATPase [Rhodobacteraceae bacterium]|nr:AFG1 family ATPase [Paracoccaceae bacterium]